VNRKTHAFALLAVLAMAAMAIAGCGGGDSTSGGAYGGEESSGAETSSSKSGGSYGSKSASSAGGKSVSDTAGGAAGGAGIVKAAKVGDLGTIIVNSEGLTLYDFHKDKGGTSACYGACAAAWPPLLTEAEPQAEAGAMANQLGTTKRKDGTVQVTYGGWPLYTYVADQAPGEANGNDIDQFGAEWYALQPSGEEPKD
jgi:predicted lipoprotein with Yx(FWY)xxD motif